MVSNYTHEGDWDVLILGSTRMPGVARVDVKLRSGLDVKKPKGAKKAHVTDCGAQPARLDIELEMMAEDLPELERVLKVLRPPGATTAQREMLIAHPQCRLFGINLVMIGDIEAPMPRAGGTYVLNIEAIEYVEQPKPAKKKPVPPPQRGDVDVRELINGLDERPSKNNAYLENFTSDDQPLGSGFGIPASLK